MAEESLQERTEEASSKRRQDYRKKGQVAQSKEVNTAILLSASLLLWFFYAPFFWHSLNQLADLLFRQVGQFPVTTVSIFQLAIFILKKTGIILAPLFLVAIVMGIFSSYIQFGWIFTFQPMVPKFSKMNPITGMKRFVSKRSLVELIKSLLKVFLVGVIAYRTVADKFSDALFLIDMEPIETVRYLARVSALVMLKVCVVLTVLAVVDFAFNKWEMEEQMKMTKQEKKEEMKDIEGDPQIKARVRSLQREAARKRMLAEVPTADVVITNPTHYAVALVYDKGKMDAPTIIAKGADHLALKIREIATAHHVPIVENPPVARLLHKLDIGQTIPEELFTAVAGILAYVYGLKKTKRQ